MRLPTLLLLPLLVACGEQDTHDHESHTHDGAGHAHDHGEMVVTIDLADNPAGLWANLNALASGFTVPLSETRRPTLASDAANLAALAEALESHADKTPDPDRAAGMFDNLARAAGQLAHEADEGGDINDAIHRLMEVLDLARRLDPASIAAPAEPTYVAGPSGGVLAELRDASGQPAGWIELKLHGDAGDLELWLARDIRISDPLGVPVSAVAKLELAGPAKTVELRARDAAANKDERGRVTVSGGRTHYLVYPGETGADASWLTGEDFRSRARLSVEGLTAEFDLTPHRH